MGNAKEQTGLKALGVSVLVQSALTTLCLCTEIFRHFVLRMNGVYDIPILTAPSLFPDFAVWIGLQFDHFHTSAFFLPGNLHFMYPPAAGLVYAFFHLFGRARLQLYVIGMVAVSLGACILFGQGLIKRGVPAVQTARICCLLLLCGYPVWFAFQRANIEFYVWLACAGGMWAYFRNRGYTAAACFGLAAAMKLYPGVYLTLFIARKQMRQLTWGVLVFGVASLLSLWLMFPHVGESLRQTAIGLRAFNTFFVQHVEALALSWDHSLFGLYKRFIHPSDAVLAVNAHRYTLTMAVVGLVLWLARIVRLPAANQVIALTAAMVLFPPVSFDYTLLHLYTALGFAVFSWWRVPASRDVTLLHILLALCISPFSEVVWHGYTLEGQIKAGLLLLLFAAAICLPVRTSQLSGA